MIMHAYVLMEGTIRRGTIVSVLSWLPELMLLQVFIPKLKKMASFYLDPIIAVAPKRRRCWPSSYWP